MSEYTKEDVEHELTVSLEALRVARAEGDLQRELDAENDMNANLELLKGLGKTAT